MSPLENLAAAATPTLGINIYLRLLPGGKLQVVMCEGKVEQAVMHARLFLLNAGILRTTQDANEH